VVGPEARRVAVDVDERVLEQIDRVQSHLLLVEQPAQPLEDARPRMLVEQVEDLALSGVAEERHQFGVESVVALLAGLAGPRVQRDSALAQLEVDRGGKRQRQGDHGEACGARRVPR
jgi:hypothetical protein